MVLKLIGFSLLLITCCVVFACGEQRTLVTDQTKLGEIEGLLQAIPVHPDMDEVTAAPTSSGESLLGKRYKSALPFADIRRFYVENLTGQGWRFEGAQQIKYKGRIRGERSLEFSRGEYRLEVRYAGERAAELGWTHKIYVRPAD